MEPSSLYRSFIVFIAFRDLSALTKGFRLNLGHELYFMSRDRSEACFY